MDCPRPEHPRPDRYRPVWQNLNGQWQFAIGELPESIDATLSATPRFPDTILVPFAPESRLSGVHDEGFHPICWYKRTFHLDAPLQSKRVLLHFGAVDYRADVWLNGIHLGQHVGGYDPFCFDVTSIIRGCNNVLVVRADDNPNEPKCSGKQCSWRYPSNCSYMRVSGIWQTVWLEGVGQAYVDYWRITPDLATGRVAIEVSVYGAVEDGCLLEAEAYFTHISQARATSQVVGGKALLQLQIQDIRAWSPDRPNIYWLDLILRSPSGVRADSVRTYFGFREIHTEGNQLVLNGSPLFFKGALDQGYYPDGLYTPPSDEAQRQDVLWAKRYGLNGIRKHQIIAEPRFYYWCDVEGLLVWSEMPSWSWQGLESADMESFLRQWQACMQRDLNHPCIITWVPTNEWRQPDDSLASAAKVHIYDFTKAFDPSRLAIDTSGYCHTKTDICDVHVNPVDGPACRRWWRSWKEEIEQSGNFPLYPDRPAFCQGFRYEGQPVIFSETGNWYIEEMPPQGKWQPYGYGPVRTAQDYIALYRDFFEALLAEPECAGFAYVQLYDVEGEANGYLTYDRKPKVDPEPIRRVHERR